MADYYEQEGNTDLYETEDGTGVYLLETSPDPLLFNNYLTRSIKAEDGISVTEKVF